jgi:hypothetical protein
MAKIKVQERPNAVSDHWSDNNFVAEMNDRYKEYKSEKVKLISLEEVVKRAKKEARKLKSKKSL